MQPIQLAEVKDLVAYERVREQMRADVIATKARRRIAVGKQLTFLFENRQTVLFQIQEMVRTERIVDAARIQDEIDAYAALVPKDGTLAATLFIEIPELIRMPQAEVRATVNRFQGLDREHAVRLAIGGHVVSAVFESGHSNEEKMAAVHYLHFVVPPVAVPVLADSTQAVRLIVDHPACAGAAELSPAQRAELHADLAG